MAITLNIQQKKYLAKKFGTNAAAEIAAQAALNDWVAEQVKDEYKSKRSLDEMIDELII